MIDEADMQFMLSEEKCFRDSTKDGNTELEELENLNNENESDRWCVLIPWSRLCRWCFRGTFSESMQRCP